MLFFTIMRIWSSFTSQKARKLSRHCDADRLLLHTTMQLFFIVAAAVMPTSVLPYGVSASVFDYSAAGQHDQP